MLLGSFQHSIDKKGRVFIPSKLRSGIGDRFIISKSLDGAGCLSIHSQEEWAELDAKIKKLPLVKARKLQRFMYSGAAEVECDAQGRICIPQSLREYASLTDNAYIIGVSDRIEIWNTPVWEEECETDTPENLADLFAEII